MPRISSLFLAAGLCIVSLAVGASTQTTWTGSTSTDWFTATNWTGGVPSSTTAAVIPSGPTNQPDVVFTGATCKSLTINASATLSITTGSIYVFGAVAVNGTLTFTTGTLLLQGDFVNSGTLNRGQGTLLFLSGGTKKLITGGAPLYNLVVSGGVVNVQASLTLASLSVNSASLNLGSFNHTIAGDCTFTGGVSGTGLITFTGNGTLSTGTASVAAVRVSSGTRRISGATISLDLTLAGGSNHIDPGTVTVHGNFDHQAGASLQVNSPGLLDVKGSVTLSGPFTMPAGRIFCRGHWTSGANFKPSGGTVQFSNGPLNINAPGSVFHDLTFNPVGTKTLQTALDVDGLLTVASNTPLDIGTFTHKIGGGLVMNGTLIGTGLIELDGTGVFTATPNAVAKVEVTAGTISVTSQAKVSSSLRVKAGKLQATTGTLSVTGTFTVDAGAKAGTDTGGVFDLDGSITWSGTCSSTGGVIRAASAWSTAATFAPSAGVVELDGGVASISNQGSFHTLRIAAGVKTATHALDVNGGLEVEAGSTLNLGAFTHAVTGGLDVEGTLAGTGDLTLDGAGDMRVTTSAPDVTVTGGPVTVNSVARLAGIFHVTTSGAFGMTVGTLTVQGNVTLDKILTLTGGVLELSGGAATLTCPGCKLADLTVTGGPKTPAGALDVAGKLTVASGGTLALGAFTHAVASGLDVEGALTGTGLIDLTGPGSLRATSLLSRLKVSGGPVTVSDTTRIDTLLEVTTTGRVDVAPGGDIGVNGDVTWDGTCGSTGGTLRCGKDFTATGTGFAPTGGTVMLDGSGGGVLSASGAVFQTLEIAAGSKTVAGAGTVAFDKELRVSGGTFTTAGGVTLSPKAAAAIRVPAGGTLELHGDSWRNPVLVAGQSSGRWTFEVKGTVGLRFFTIRDLDTGGLHVDGGAFAGDPLLGNGTFDAGAPAGVYFKVSGFNQTTTLRNVYFRTDPGTSAKNVQYAATTGRIVFENALGAFKGAAHENDPNGRVDWTLGPTSALRLTEVYQDSPRGVEVAALDTPVDLDGRILAFGKAGGATGSFTLPVRVLELGDYVELREGTGSGGPSLVFLGGALPWSVGGGGFASVQNTATGGGIDFVRWGGSSQAAPTGTAFTDARGSLPAPEAGQSLGRDMDLTDTDTREDWEPGSGRHATYPTRGARNILFGVPYLWEGGEDPNPFTVDAPGPANLWHVDVKRFFNPNSRKPEAGPPPDRKAWTFNTGSPAYNYKTGGRVLGALLSPPIRLPDETDVRLGYFEWLETRNPPAKDKDLCIVEMRELGTTLWVQLVKYTTLVSSFTERTLDVSALKGKDVEVRWTFDSVDADPGNHEGWYVDYITVYRTSQGHPLVSPCQNGPPPPPPASSPPEGDVPPTGDWVYGGSGFYGKIGQPTQLRFVPIGSTALGMEVKTGLFAVRRVPGPKPGTWKDVVVFQAVPPELTGFIRGEPYPEIRLPLPVVPGLAFRVLPVEEASILLPVSGMPAPVPDAPAVEVTAPVPPGGGEVVIRPFGLDENRQPVQRHTLRFLILWDWQ